MGQETIADTKKEGVNVSKGGNKTAAKQRFYDRERERWNRKKIKRVGSPDKVREPMKRNQAGR